MSVSESLMMRHRPSPAWKKWTTRCRASCERRDPVVRWRALPGFQPLCRSRPSTPVIQTVRRPVEKTSREQAGISCDPGASSL